MFLRTLLTHWIYNVYGFLDFLKIVMTIFPVGKRKINLLIHFFKVWNLNYKWKMKCLPCFTSSFSIYFPGTLGLNGVYLYFQSVFHISEKEKVKFQVRLLNTLRKTLAFYVRLKWWSVMFIFLLKFCLYARHFLLPSRREYR